MSLSGAFTTAVTGIDAQSAALGAISDNVANSQTSGYKRIETTFATLLSVSDSREHQPGGVLSRPATPTMSRARSSRPASRPTSLSRATGSSPSTAPTASRPTARRPSAAPPSYTRAGDFNIDNAGFLTNTAGDYLDGSIEPRPTRSRRTRCSRSA